MVMGGGRHVDNYRAPTQFAFASPQALDGLLFRWRLLQVDRVMPSNSDDQALSHGTAALFTSGRLAMFHSGLWKTPGFRNEIHNFDWDVAPFPRKRGLKPAYWSAASGYAIRANAKDPALCWELVKFMAGPIGERRIAAAGLAQPALRSLDKSPAFLDGKRPLNKRMLLFCANHVRTPPAWSRWTEFNRTVWEPMTDPLWFRGYHGDPAALLRQVQAVGNERFFGIKRTHRSHVRSLKNRAGKLH